MTRHKPTSPAPGESGGAASEEALARAQSKISEALDLFAAGDVGAAEECLEQALSAVPGHPDALHLLGLAAKTQGDDAKAIELIERALERMPRHPVFHNNLGNIRLDLGNEEAAADHYRQAIDTEPGYAEAHFNLGIALERQGRADEAVASYRNALEHNPDYVEAHFNLGSALESVGDSEAGVSEYRQAVAISPGYARAYYRIASAGPEVLADSELQAMEDLLARAEAGSDAAIHLQFGLARAFADRDDPDRAFRLWEKANAAKRATYEYDVAESVQYHESIAAKFTVDLLEAMAGSGNDGEAPIFIVGMPRSGTSLVEQILASHPQVGGAGELTYLRDIVRALAREKDGVAYPEYAEALTGRDIEGAAKEYIGKIRARVAPPFRVADKMPGNFLYLGMVRLMLPNARIVHCVRDPVATCFSCYTHLFNAPQRFTYDLTDLGTFHRSYRRLMTHWHSVLPGRIIDIRYEDLVAEQEVTTRRLLEFCGLEWDDACLSFHETKRPVRTASAAQVRQPLYSRALRDWKRYEKHLSPLLEALQEDDGTDAGAE